jgi:hypothetical protein
MMRYMLVGTRTWHQQLEYDASIDIQAQTRNTFATCIKVHVGIIAVYPYQYHYRRAGLAQMSEAVPEVVLEHETLPMPELDYRWVHTGSQYLDLLPTPITTAATIYKAFSPDESRRIQEAWDAFTPEERQKAIHDWGRKEGEGFATPATKARDTKDKEKEKEKERRGSNVSHRSVGDEEAVRSGEEQPREDEKDGDGKYKDFLAAAQQEYENLELISGVPVSQVGLAWISYTREK